MVAISIRDTDADGVVRFYLIDRGEVRSVGNLGMLEISDRGLSDMRRLAEIQVDSELIRFNVVVRAPWEGQPARPRAAGVHVAEFNLRTFRLADTVPIHLFEPKP